MIRHALRRIRRPSRLRGLVAALVVAFVCGQTAPAFAYLKFGYRLNGRDFTLRWNASPVRYFITDSGVPGVPAESLQQAAARAFATWEAVPTASVTYQFGGFTRGVPGEDDGRSTLGFLNQPEFERVLAATSYLIDAETGELIESDIFFNAAFAWSVAPAGEAGRWDLESVALHEIGHLNGLGHSAIGETELIPGGGRRVVSIGATMFPIALATGDISGRHLYPDDIAGVSDLYPDGDFARQAGSISGHVRRDGVGVFGAHVVAFHAGTGQSIANFTLTDDGEFSIAGLQPGPYVLRVEPLDDADTASFFQAGIPIDLDFRVHYHPRLVIVPRGGDSGSIDIDVVSK
ncbi:MAG: matrixin family metalloprotease [Vicinamibacterales bacterium]